MARPFSKVPSNSRHVAAVAARLEERLLTEELTRKLDILRLLADGKPILSESRTS